MQDENVKEEAAEFIRRTLEINANQRLTDEEVASAAQKVVAALPRNVGKQAA